VEGKIKTGKVGPEFKAIGAMTRVSDGSLKSEDGELDVTVGWGHPGQGGIRMPGDLLKAHQVLDRAVDRCYRPEAFESDRQRVEYLSALYEKLTAPFLPVAKKGRGKRAKQD
jgi:hypothetical protein